MLLFSFYNILPQTVTVSHYDVWMDKKQRYEHYGPDRMHKNMKDSGYKTLKKTSERVQ